MKHVNQQHKTQCETRESNSTKHNVKHVNPTAQNKVKHVNPAAQNKVKHVNQQHKVKHVNPTAQNIKLNTFIQQHKTQCETRESNSTQHKVKHANTFVISLLR